MPVKKKVEKKLTLLEPSFKDILICKNKKLTSHIETFLEEGENISQKNLGTLIGIFEVEDQSEDSSYIVNYIISVIKKEFFSKLKRGSIESLESALHKANLALSNLARHDNIGWIGKFNAVCAVIEKNNLHFAQTGNAHTLLLRTKTISDIGEGMAETGELNPLKTFIDISSGKLQNEDRLIFTTNGILEIFSLDEIKKASTRFEEDKFFRFLKTALSNELEQAAVLIASFREKKIEEVVAKTPNASKKSIPNAFSQQSFTREKANLNTLTGKDFQEIEKELNKEKSKKEFVDEKTGHIYIKGDTLEEKTEKHLDVSLRLQDLREKIKSSSRSIFSTINSTKRAITQKKKRFPKKNIAFSQKVQERLEGIPWSEYKASAQKSRDMIATFFSQKVSLAQNKLRKIPRPEISIKPLHSNDFFRKKITSPCSQFLKLTIGKSQQILSRIDLRRKIFFSSAILLIVLIPLFLLKSRSEKPRETQAQEETKTFESAIQETNLPSDLPATTEKITYAKENILKVLILNQKVYAIEKSGITEIESQKHFPFPESISDFKNTTVMPDLNTVFILSDNKVTSFTPNNGKFQDNSISLPNDLSHPMLSTYLTYLYVADKVENQIYRYPRAEGGFGEKLSWLKESIDLSKSSDMTIGENLFLLSQGKILKFSQGKQENFSLDYSQINPAYIFATQDSPHLFALDKQAGKIFKLDTNGEILKQIFNPSLKNTKGFAVDEENQKAYFLEDQGIKLIDLQ